MGTHQNDDVLVVESRRIDEAGRETALNTNWRWYADRIFAGGAVRMMGLDQAERDERFKQIVVYVLLEHEGRLLSYIRCAADGESRLAGRRSIGLGGHLDGSDVEGLRDGLASVATDGISLLLSAGEREVHEEVIVATAYESTLCAVVNDDRDAVGRVHFGFVQLWRLREPQVEARERGICQLRFASPEELGRSGQRLEGWSELCLDYVRRSGIDSLA